MDSPSSILKGERKSMRPVEDPVLPLTPHVEEPPPKKEEKKPTIESALMLKVFSKLKTM